MDEHERTRIRAAIDAAEGGGAPPLSDEQLRTLLAESRTIAIVGASPKADRPSHGVLLALKAAGWRILPVNPSPDAIRDGIAGLPCYPTLAAAAASLPAGERIDLVDVFRRSEECEEIANESVRVGARGLWLQLGVFSSAAASIAASASMSFVQDRCPAIEILRLGISGPNERAST